MARGFDSRSPRRRPARSGGGAVAVVVFTALLACSGSARAQEIAPILGARCWGVAVSVLPGTR